MAFLTTRHKEPTVILGASDNANGFITVFGQQDSEATLGFNNSGRPMLTLEREKHQFISLGTDRNDKALLLMKNRSGDILLQAGVAERGYGHVGVRDKDGRNPSVFLPTSVR